MAQVVKGEIAREMEDIDDIKFLLCILRLFKRRRRRTL